VPEVELFSAPRLSIVLFDRLVAARQELILGEPVMTLPFTRREDYREDAQTFASTLFEKACELYVDAVFGIEERLTDQQQRDVGPGNLASNLVVPPVTGGEILVNPEPHIAVAF